MRWVGRARRDAVAGEGGQDQAAAVTDSADNMEVWNVAKELRSMVNMVRPDEFYGHETNYDHDAGEGRELLFLIANHEWVRATSEIVDISRSDVVQTSLKIDIDLSRITHEAFRKRTGLLWLPVAVLPPQTGQRQVEPDPFAAVTDAAGNLLPLLPADDRRHQIAAALAEIIVNMAVAHLPSSISETAGGKSRGGQTAVPLVATRDQRVLLSAAIYRMLGSGPGRDVSSPESEPPATPRIIEARKTLLHFMNVYISYLERLAKGPEPRAQFVPELAQRAITVLKALAESIIVVVPLNYDNAPTVLTVRVPTRILKSVSDPVRKAKPSTWLIRPSGQLAIDVLLPTADADRQIEIHLPDGVAFEEPARSGDPAVPASSARNLLPRLDIAVKTPPPLQDFIGSMKQICSMQSGPGSVPVVRSLVDLALAKATVAFDALRHYEVRPGDDPALPTLGNQSATQKAHSSLRLLTRKLSLPAGGIDAALAGLRASWKATELHNLTLFRNTSADRLGPRTVVARAEMIEDVTKRAAPKRATIYVDIKVDDREYFSTARASTLMSLILMVAVLCFLFGWHFVKPVISPAPEVLAIVLTLFATIQASRIERPDRSALRGQLYAFGNWLIAASMLPAVTLAVALAFASRRGGWAAIFWTAGAVAVQAALLALMWHGPLTPIGPSSVAPRGKRSVGQRRKFKTEPLNYSYFEALRSDYWRNTTAEALMIGRMAYGYIIWQGADSSRAAESMPPKLEPLLTQGTGLAAADEASSILALLHSSTQRQAVTFVVFRGKPGDNWAADGNIRKIGLDLDPDRLAPMDSVTSTIDIFVGVPANTVPTVEEHPLIVIMREAKNKLIPLEAQLPIPAPMPGYYSKQWARIRVALRDTKDIGRLTNFLDAISRKVARSGGPGYIVAVQCVPTVLPRIITCSEAKLPAAEAEAADDIMLLTGDLDVSHVRAIMDEPASARTWRMIAVCADARSNVESDIIQHLPFPQSGFQLAHLNYARLHGTAVIVMLVHDMGGASSEETRAGGQVSCQAQGQVTGAGAGAEKPPWGQPRILVDAEVSRDDLGPMMQYPLVRIRYRWQDRPGAFLNVLSSVGEALSNESPPIEPKNCSVSYARLQVASGSLALGHLTVRIKAPAQGEKDWNPMKKERMGRMIGALAALKAESAGASSPRPDNLGRLEDPVIRIDLTSKMSKEAHGRQTGRDPHDDHHVSEAKMSGPAIQPPPYLEEQDPAFAEGLKHLQWVKNADFGLLVLQGACPVCDDGDGIDIAVPTVIAQFRADREVAAELVTCSCSKNHGAPAGKSGCGRWGYATPSVGEG